MMESSGINLRYSKPPREIADLLKIFTVPNIFRGLAGGAGLVVFCTLARFTISLVVMGRYALASGIAVLALILGFVLSFISDIHEIPRDVREVKIIFEDVEPVLHIHTVLYNARMILLIVMSIVLFGISPATFTEGSFYLMDHVGWSETEVALLTSGPSYISIPIFSTATALYRHDIEEASSDEPIPIPDMSGNITLWLTFIIESIIGTWALGFVRAVESRCRLYKMYEDKFACEEVT